MKLLSLILLLGGCNLTPREQVAFTALVVGQVADGWTTTRNTGLGARELNPLLDDHPSEGDVILFKAAVVGGFLLLGELDKDNRTFWYLVGAGSGAASAAWNSYLYDHERP